MAKFISWFISAFERVLNILDSVVFTFGNVQVSYLTLLLCLFIICFVLSVFWKGAHR